MIRLAAAFAAVVALAAAAAPASADEGMWTFDEFPTARANQATGLRLDRAWLDRVQAGAVRIGGCSASLVSREGLILTNQHCIRSCLQALSTPDRDLVGLGYQTASRADERRCPGQTAEVLTAITDVTARVNAATEGKTGADFVRTRDAALSAIEAEGCGADPKKRCQVVTLHRGGQYKLYAYRRYDDVRMVFAPEHQSVIFGGDPDNFNFPRFALDAAFLRAYEDGKPAVTPNALRWNARAPRAGEPVFVAGNPGSTSRLRTASQLETERDYVLPSQIKRLSELRGRLLRCADESDENRRMTRSLIRGTENNLKRAYGMHRALADRAFMDAKRRADTDFWMAVLQNPELNAATGDPWGEIDRAQAEVPALFERYDWLESQAGGGSTLFGYARALVRAADERAKPSGERLPEYADSRLPQVRTRVLADPRLDLPVEELLLAFWLDKTREALGTDAPEVVALLGRESPQALAARLIAETRLKDRAYREAIWEGRETGADDPLIRLVRASDAAARQARTAWTTRVDAPVDRAAERLARARFAVHGDRVYPDATGTLRLSWGRIEGWTEAGRTVAPITTVQGLWDRATGAFPFDLAPRWAAARDRLDPTVPFTVATTNDIIGGNSGSPLIDARGEVIGAVFDGNLQSLGGAYGYDGTTNRAVAVTAAAVEHALLRIYDQPHLVAELRRR